MTAQINFGLNTPVAWLFDPANPDHLAFREKAEELFRLIADLEKMKGWAFAKIKWLAKRLNISKRYAQKLIRILRGAGLIEIKRRAQNYYRVLISFSNKSKQSRESSRYSMIQRSSDNRDETNQTGPMVDKAMTESDLPPEMKAATIAQEIEERIEATPMEEPTVAPEVKQAVEEAAKEVKKEIINSGGKRPTAYHYCAAVMRLLAAWKIEAPRQLVGDVVMQRWQSWF